MHQKFRSVEDFVADESFQEFCLGTKPESIRKWKRYIRKNPALTDVIELAEAMVLMLSGDGLKDQKVLSKKPKIRAKGIILGIAATIAICVFCVAVVQNFNSRDSWKSFVVENDFETIVLPDNSRIECRKGSELKIHGRFLKKREIIIDGEAFFQVEKNARAPQFKVHTAHGQIQVLGTTFLVRTSNKDVKVLLEEGAIEFENKTDEYRLYPGDLLFLDNESINIKHGVDSESYALWRQDKITFNQRPLVEILQVLERSYDLKIELTNENLKERIITASVGKNDPMLLLRAISNIYDIEMTAENNLIILK